MQDLVVEGKKFEELIQKAFPEVISEMLTKSYSNPLHDAIEEEIKAQDGAIKQFVKGVFANLLSSPEFKDTVTKEIIAQIIQKGIGRG
jgi:hypothetical protein